MLVHLRRSVILAIVALVATFIYAFAGTGVAQLFFSHQADGSLTANGSTLIGQNWSDHEVPGPPLGQLRVPGTPRRPGPVLGHREEQPEPGRTPRRRPLGGQRRGRESPGPPTSARARRNS